MNTKQEMFAARTRLKASKSTDSILNVTGFPNSSHLIFLNDRSNFLNQTESLNRSQTANLAQNSAEVNLIRNINKRTFKESRIDSPDSIKSNTNNIDEQILENSAQKDQTGSQSEAFSRINQLKETQAQHQQQQQQQKTNINNKNLNTSNIDDINEQQILIEWEQINFIDDQHDKIIDSLKFQVDSLTLKMESLTEDDAHLANEFVNQLDGFGKMNLVKKISKKIQALSPFIKHKLFLIYKNIINTILLQKDQRIKSGIISKLNINYLKVIFFST